MIDGKLQASTIYSWFVEDFDVDGGVIAHFKQYGEASLVDQLVSIDRVADYEYDWTLNDFKGTG